MYIGHFTVSEFASNSHAPYLNSRPDTNVMNMLIPSELSRTEISRHIVMSLQGLDSQQHLTAFHVRWAMEGIAYAFSLPVEDATIIRNAMNIYKSWLNLDNSNSRPEIIADDEEFYQGEILMHLSLLFDRKIQKPDSRHSELCKSALMIYLDLVRLKPISETTWRLLLKLLMLIVPTQHGKTADFNQILYATLFEIWASSDTRDLVLWKDLENICTSDEMNEWLVYQWASLAKALTRRVVHIIYGDDKGILEVKFKAINSQDRSTVHLTISYEQTLYFWFRVLQLPLSLKKPVRDPTIHFELCLAVDKIADCFLFLSILRCEKMAKMPSFDGDYRVPSLVALVRGNFDQHNEYFARQRRLPVPGVNALLELLGPWLFASASVENTYFEKGLAISARTLCKIMCRAAGPVSDENLRLFYGVFLRAFGSHAELVTTEILIHSQTLFTLDHKGVRSLITYEAVIKALTTAMSENKSLELQYACVNTAASVSALPLYYAEHAALHKHYRVLGEQLELVFIKMIRTERKSEIFHKIIWSACVFCASAGQVRPVEKVIEAMLTKLQSLDMLPERDMFLELLKVIATLPFLIAPRGFTTSKEVAIGVLEALSKLIAPKFGQIQSDSKQMHLYFTILHWLSCFPQVAEDETTRRRIIKVMKEGVDQGRNQPAQYALRRIQHILGRELPPIQVGSNLFMHFSPSSQVLRVPDIHSTGKYFMLGTDVLVSLFDTEADREEVLMVIRDMFGRYVWKAQLVYRSNQPTTPAPTLFIQTTSGPLLLPRPKSDPSQEDILMSDLTDHVTKIHKQLVGAMRSQEHTEQQFLNSVPKKEFVGPLTSFTSSGVPKAHRLFLAQLGFLNTKSLSKILALEQEKIVDFVYELDKHNEREKLVLPLLYLSQAEATPAEVMTCTDDYTTDFQEFLRTMGVPINSECSYRLFDSLEDEIQRYGCTLYSAGYHYELLTVTPALMSEEKLASLQLSSLLHHREIVVIWNARRNDPHSAKNPTIFGSHELDGKFVIMITPLINKLYRIYLSKESGPLLNNMVIPMALLGPLVTRTVLNMNSKSYINSLETCTSRKKLLTQVYEAGSKLQEQTPNFATLFSYAFAH